MKWLQSRERSQVKWEPVSSQWFKLNFDAAWHSGKTCIAGVVRDHNGRILLAWTTKSHVKKGR